MAGLNYNNFKHDGNEDEINALISGVIAERIEGYQSLIDACNGYIGSVGDLKTAEDDILEDFDEKAYKNGSTTKRKIIANMEEVKGAIDTLESALQKNIGLFSDAEGFYSATIGRCTDEIAKAHKEIDAEYAKLDDEAKESFDKEAAYKSVIYHIVGESVTHTK